MVLRCTCGGVIIEGEDTVCSKCGVVYGVQPANIMSYIRPTDKRSQGVPWRLYRINRRILNSTTNNMNIIIENICKKLSLPNAIYRRATSLNNMAILHGVQRGYDVYSRASAVVTLACRLEGVPRTTKAVCDATGAKPGVTHHIYGVIVKKLNIRVPPPDPTMYISSIAKSCDVPEVQCRQAIYMLDKKAATIQGKDPTTLAAAALYIVCKRAGLHISQQRLASAARTSTVSLRLRTHDLE